MGIWKTLPPRQRLIQFKIVHIGTLQPRGALVPISLLHGQYRWQILSLTFVLLPLNFWFNG